MADSREMLKIACAALEDKKAFDIKIIDISRISTLCDYIVIADGTNKKQVRLRTCFLFAIYNAILIILTIVSWSNLLLSNAR